MCEDDKRTDQATRRTFLKTAAVAGGAALVYGCEKPKQAVQAASQPTPSEAPLPDGLSPDDFFVHGTSPISLETRPERFRDAYIAPNRFVFVRSKLLLPSVNILRDRDAWETEVLGVGAPRTVTLGELKGFGLETVVAVLQCSGNGRTYFEHCPSGSQWGTDAAANVVWTGVSLSALSSTASAVQPPTRRFNDRDTGVGAMPSQDTILSPEEIEAVAAYVSEVAGH